MRFRPCIDIHNGKVKQIVGGSLSDKDDKAKENFVSTKDADFYARLYRDKGLKGGHVIILNGRDSEYYEATRAQAMLALKTYPGGLMVGGGINPDNAMEYIDAGASHVIVTSYVFRDGRIDYDNLQKMKAAVGRERLVLDLSCRKKEGRFFVVTDRWQKFTDEELSLDLLNKLSEYCDEYLIHAVDVEGKAQGIDAEVVKIMASYEGRPVTYAGGVGDYESIELLRDTSGGKIDVTIGSAMDTFGGPLMLDKVLQIVQGGKPCIQ